jgi:two-component system, LytTR family, response regulator
MKIRTLIVDDEPLARQRIRTLLAGEKDIDIIGECADGCQALEAVAQHRPDLVFLDVQMPLLDGFGVLEGISGERMPTVIFVTAYDRFALKAFEVHALDYLLKPFDRQRFHKALERARVQVQHPSHSKINQQLLDLLEDVKGKNKFLDRLVVKSEGRVSFVRAEEIDWIEAAGNYLRLHVGKDTHLLRETMSKLEARLNPRQFLRIHRSTIVNLDRIRELEPTFHGDYAVLLRNGTELTLSRGYRDKLQGLLGNAL